MKSLDTQTTSLFQVPHFEAKHWHAKGYGGNNQTAALRRLMLANKHVTACAKEAPHKLATSRYIPMFVGYIIPVSKIQIIPNNPNKFLSRVLMCDKFCFRIFNDWPFLCLFSVLPCRWAAEPQTIVSCRACGRMSSGSALLTESPWRWVCQVQLISRKQNPHHGTMGLEKRDIYIMSVSCVHYLSLYMCIYITCIYI